MSDVIVWGDSIPASCADYLAWFYALRGMSTEMHTWGGTAPCDWLDDMLECPAPARAVVVSFSGNQLTPCMTNRMGVTPGATLIRDDLAFAAKTFHQRGFTVLWCSSPSRVGTRTGSQWLIPTLQGFAAQYPTKQRYVDAGAVLAQPDGMFQMWLPCQPHDVDTGNCYLGVVNVREDDGAHLRPSGRRRYAEAIVNAT